MVQPFRREKLSVELHFYNRTINITYLDRLVARLQTLDGKMSLSWKNIWNENRTGMIELLDLTPGEEKRNHLV